MRKGDNIFFLGRAENFDIGSILGQRIVWSLYLEKYHAAGLEPRLTYDAGLRTDRI